MASQYADGNPRGTGRLAQLQLNLTFPLIDVVIEIEDPLISCYFCFEFLCDCDKLIEVAYGDFDVDVFAPRTTVHRLPGDGVDPRQLLGDFAEHRE